MCWDQLASLALLVLCVIGSSIFPLVHGHERKFPLLTQISREFKGHKFEICEKKKLADVFQAILEKKIHSLSITGPGHRPSTARPGGPQASTIPASSCSAASYAGGRDLRRCGCLRRRGGAAAFGSEDAFSHAFQRILHFACAPYSHTPWWTSLSFLSFFLGMEGIGHELELYCTPFCQWRSEPDWLVPFAETMPRRNLLSISKAAP